MIEETIQDNTGFLSRVKRLEEGHPYSFSFILALLFVSYLLFYTPSLEISEEDYTPTEHIQFIDITQIEARAPKRIVKKQFSIKEGDVSESAANIERAVGTSDDPNAVDIAFFPNIAPPKPIGKLKKLYPKIAKEMNIEAIINVELLIATNGKVRNVDILGIRLTKALPTKMHIKISSVFARDARKILLGAQFTPPIVNGKRVPIKMELPLRFRLE
ncbi:MAG: energy transducer TonB [Spirochaetota bacterium]|nr:energy transducer TonB [Spirochaetota bacterium]